MTTPKTLSERFWEKVDKAAECWVWTATKYWKGAGYGGFWLKGRTVGAHRASWEITYGDIPKGRMVLHQCNNPVCVKPSHLYLGNHSDNIRDAVRAGTHVETRKTHCPQGHPYSLENTYYSVGRRRCRTCNKAKCRIKYLKRRGS